MIGASGQKHERTPFHTLCIVGFLFQLYKAYIRPILSYASPGWYPFLCDTLKKDLEVYHRRACRVISGSHASTPVPLLLLESLTPTPLLEITLNHQALAFYELP